MNEQKRVCSIGASKRLKCLGVRQESAFVHMKTKHAKGVYFVTDAIRPILTQPEVEWYSAFLLDELGLLFKDQISKVFELCADYEHTVWQENEIEARAEIIIRGIESGLLTV